MMKWALRSAIAGSPFSISPSVAHSRWIRPAGGYVLTFNGEIYNHLALRQELQASGPASWCGTSDTETLLAGFVAWGVAATLKKAVGMFALALWDRAERRLTLARDRFGEKPLYYGFIGRGAATAFVFGSELKALRAHPDFDNPIDRGAVALFLRFCYTLFTSQPENPLD